MKQSSHSLTRTAGLLALITIASCTTAPEAEQAEPKAEYQKSDFSNLPAWHEDNLDNLHQALARSCPLNKKRSAAWAQACANAPQEPNALRRFIETHYDVWHISDNGDTEGLFTGYYQSSIKASLTRHGAYQHPLYALPHDLLTADLGAFKPELAGQKITGRVEGNKFVPYPDRASITRNGLNADVLMWADNAFDVFTLQIQGSGRAEMDNGQTRNIGYAGQNGRPYTAIGKILKERGALQGKVTMGRIQEWVEANPTKAQDLLNENASYIFFKETPKGAIGAQGVALTAERSMAVDRRFTPLGALVWLSAAHPQNGTINRLFVAQDTGGAIKGAVRGDVYWGHGAEAKRHAGAMQSRGQMWLLLPKNVQP